MFALDQFLFESETYATRVTPDAYPEPSRTSAAWPQNQLLKWWLERDIGNFAAHRQRRDHHLASRDERGFVR